MFFRHRARARKPELQKFVTIRDHSWFKKPPFAKPLQDRSRARKPELQTFVAIRVPSWFKKTTREDPLEQISGSKARTTEIRVHSCPFVVQNNTLLTHPFPPPSHSCPFVVQNTHPHEAPSGQISGWKARATLIRDHSCPFVVQNAPSPPPPHSCPFVVQHTPSPFCGSRFARLPPPRYNSVSSAHRSLSVAPVVFPRNVHHGPVRQAPQRIH